MATYQKYLRKDGTVSITATIRKVGFKPYSSTFVEPTEKRARRAAETWSFREEKRIEQKRDKDPRAARIPLEIAFRKHFNSFERSKLAKVQQRKKDNTITWEKHVRNALYRSPRLGRDIYLNEITAAVMSDYRDDLIDEGLSGSTIRNELYLISNLFLITIEAQLTSKYLEEQGLTSIDHYFT